MTHTITIGNRLIGAGQPVYFIAEIGINHNGNIDLAKKLMDVAHASGCEAVKFQKRTPDICVPEEQKNLMRETPWGTMTYLDYKKRIEFGQSEFEEIDKYARSLEIHWFASPWDIPSVDFLEKFNPPCHKVASACITDMDLLHALRKTGRPIILSTGMSSMDEISAALKILAGSPIALAQSTSTYPCKPEELNLLVIPSFIKLFEIPIGYSGHETGLQTTLAAAALGASFIERHITLDRSMWGTDHSASLEPGGLAKLVRDIRVVERAMGDGKKRVYESEIPIRARLRRK